VRGRNIALLPLENDTIIVGIITQLKWKTIVICYDLQVIKEDGSYKKILFEESQCIIYVNGKMSIYFQ